MATVLFQQTSLIQSLVEQLWNSKPHHYANTTFNSESGASLSNLPIELIELIIAHVDTETLFKLCRVNQLLRALAQPRLINHAQQITMRLWIHQHPLVSNKPLDFTFSSCGDNNRMLFEPSRDAPTSLTLQAALPPPQIDGCTILIKVHNTRRIYSISYKDCLVPVPLEQNITGYKSSENVDVDGAYGCGWNFSYTIRDDDRTSAIKYLYPKSFSCDTDLLDPQVLISSSSEKVEQQQQPKEEEKVESHDEKKKMMMMQDNEDVNSSSWVTKIVNDTMTSFYRWLSA
ncbi:hypothetical protein BDC45DRAFT_603636 [Circinella umbellata]|nr:hypothetical protein BDC45DRAFT_603636 [Circinella umbellata]